VAEDYNYKIKKETLEQWLLLLYRLSESDNIENAISVAKMYAEDDEQREIINKVSVFFRSECSGEIDPPIRMREFYSKIVALKKKAS